MKSAFPQNNQLAFIALSILLLVMGVVLSLTYLLASKAAEAVLKEDAVFNLERLTTDLNSTLAKHNYLPKVLAQNSTVREFLAKPEALSPAKQLEINQYLSRINTLSETLDIYLMLPGGITVAASNWEKKHSFVGKNFSFRPYFIQAMDNRLGRYYALGTTSQERGYYFASPVHHQGKTVGVAVVKVAVGAIEQGWNNDMMDFMVTDPHGVVFLASHKDWQFHSLTPLSDEVAKRLKLDLKYGDHVIAPLKLDIQPATEGYSQVRYNDRSYLMLGNYIEDAEWQVFVLMNRKGVRAQIAWSLLTAVLATLLIATLLILVVQRQRERRRFETHEREVLEQKVAERTRELKLAQEELIQAGKMAALGQLSASINHELNNPLAAIRAYADNAVKFMDNSQHAMVEKNLQKISNLTERMATITHQLKSFARKSEGKIEAVSIYRALESSLSILKPQVTKHGVEITRYPDNENVHVQADQIWLEQILINLLKNAIDATQEKGIRKLSIVVSRIDNMANISIMDNGKGFQEDQLAHVFEPFFTTKKSGKGLGLGLSISYRLAKDMHGNLSAENHPDGGAVFHLSLPLAN